jgi:hypothetical protein
MIKEAMKLALEALECALSDDKPHIDECEKAIKALEEALAKQKCVDANDTSKERVAKAHENVHEQEQGEPVAFITPLMEYQMFDDWCPYKGNPDPRTIWAAAIKAVNGLLLGAKPEQGEPMACDNCKKLEDELEHLRIKSELWKRDAIVWKSAYDVEVGFREQEQGEPVAWYIRDKDSATTDGCWAEKNLDICEPLYTTPSQSEARGLSQQQRKPLTDEQIEIAENQIWNTDQLDEVERQANKEFVRAIEAAHNIKE